MTKASKGQVFLGGGCQDTEQIEGEYWCCCVVCGEPVGEDGPDFCPDCLHIPQRRRVWGRLDKPDENGCPYGWTHTHKNWIWEPYGDGSGDGQIMKTNERKEGETMSVGSPDPPDYYALWRSVLQECDAALAELKRLRADNECLLEENERLKADSDELQAENKKLLAKLWRNER